MGGGGGGEKGGGGGGAKLINLVTLNIHIPYSLSYTSFYYLLMCVKLLGEWQTV